MLKLRRGTVVSDDPLVVEVGGRRRPAWADVGLVGEARSGDEVIVNVEALDLGLGSGGYDVVHANLSRGLDGAGAIGDHVMKLNYTSLQHPVAPIELSGGEPDEPRAEAAPPVLVLPLHGHLAPAAWAAKQARPELSLGFVQTDGGALPGRLSSDVAELRERGLIHGSVTAGAAYGGDFEAISLPGALDAAARDLGWSGLLVGPGPGIIGSESRFGHGGMTALASAHAALALGHPTLLSPRLSSGDQRSQHRGLSHHTATVLGLLLAGVRVPVPELPDRGGENPARMAAAEAVEEIRSLRGARHDVVTEPADLEGYAASGLPARTMGRGLEEDPLFFAAALGAGRALGHATPTARGSPE